MRMDQETVASLARGHRVLFPRHRTKAVRNGMTCIVGYICDGASDWEPCEVDWFIVAGPVGGSATPADQPEQGRGFAQPERYGPSPAAGGPRQATAQRRTRDPSSQAHLSQRIRGHDQ